MSITTEIDHNLLREARLQFDIIQGEFETVGQLMVGVKDKFPSAVQGAIADAIQNALGNTHTHIRELCQMLQVRILEPMDKVGIEASQESLGRATEIERLIAEEGSDGVANTGDVTGNWADDTFEDTSAMGQDQSRIDLNFDNDR